MVEVCSEEPGRALLVSGILYVFIYENLPGQDTAGMIFHGVGTVRHDLPFCRCSASATTQAKI